MRQSESKGQFLTFCESKSEHYVVQMLQGTHKHLRTECSKQNFVQVNATRDFPSYVKQARCSAFLCGIATFAGSSSITSKVQTVFLQGVLLNFFHASIGNRHGIPGNSIDGREVKE